MVMISFQQVKLSGSKSGTCPTCGKKVTRRKTVTQTVNPFNRNADGVPKTQEEVQASVREALKAWKEQPAYHAKCERSLSQYLG